MHVRMIGGVRRRHWSVAGIRLGFVQFTLICCVCFTFTGVVLFWPASLDNELSLGYHSGSNSIRKVEDSELMKIIIKIRKTSKRDLHFMSPLRIFGNENKEDEISSTNHINDSITVHQESLETDSEWLRANSDSDPFKLLVYSAYWDNRLNYGCVRVIATTLTKHNTPIQCRLHFHGITETLQVTAVKKPLNEHWNLKYASYFLSCCLPGNVEGTGVKVVPERVTIYLPNSEKHGATLNVRDNTRATSKLPRGQMALCVKPFHYNFNRATWLVEFIEYNLLMGVEQFLFYNNTVGLEVQRVLQGYKDKGLVSVLPWKLDVVTKKEIRTEGMFGALNDCLYRLMFLYKYVMVVDIDEYVVPKIHNNYGELISFVTKKVDEDNQKKMSFKKHEKCVVGLSFRNFFFYMYWDNDTSLFGHEPEKAPRFLPYLLTQYKTRRLAQGNKHGQRSKYLVAPDKALELGNHGIWRKLPGCETVLVPENLAALHHYRICEFGGYECLKKANTVDRVAHKFGIDLLKSVLRSCFQIFPEVGSTCPITGPLGSPW